MVSQSCYKYVAMKNVSHPQKFAKWKKYLWFCECFFPTAFHSALSARPPPPPHSFGDSLYHQYGTRVQPAPRTSSVALPLGLALYAHTGQQTKPLTQHKFFHFTSLAKMFSSSPDMVTRRLFAASSLPANKTPLFGWLPEPGLLSPPVFVFQTI